MSFSYAELTSRNLGFLTEEEQARLRASRVFIPGVGGMGGTALECLARSGIEKFIISDPDTFEVSNLNRQMFSALSLVGKNKAEAARASLLDINPGANVEIVGADWPERLGEILPRVDVVLNGCDDHLATIQLMRKAGELGKTVIDAYASVLPSVYVVKPGDPRPETTLGFPSVGLEASEFTPALAKECAACEMVYVLTHSSSARHVVMKHAAEMVRGERKRISLAPMVWATGVLMSYEALKVVLDKPDRADSRGVFLNPWRFRYERPARWPLSSLRRFFVRRFLAKMAPPAGENGR